MGWRQRTKIYNTATFDNPDDKLKLDEVFEKLEAYAKPQSNQILARFQLRCLKQGDMPLEEFVTKARLLIDDSGYSAEVKDETLRDTLVFGLKSDQVRRDAIKLGNTVSVSASVSEFEWLQKVSSVTIFHVLWKFEWLHKTFCNHYGNLNGYRRPSITIENFVPTYMNVYKRSFCNRSLVTEDLL